MGFPDGFIWGAAMSAFQVEMGMGEMDPNSDWFLWVHDKKNIEKETMTLTSTE